MSRLKVVFFGTPTFAAECLSYLIQKGVEVCGVVTQPDRPRGRSLKLSPSPVKQVTLPEIPLFQPEKASNPDFLKELAHLQADLFVVVAFGQILSQKLLDIPPLGCINTHTSLLPKYRGAAPIQRCLMAGEKETGVCIQKMVKELDAGDIIATSKTEIPDEMNFKELEEKLLDLTKPLLFSVIQNFEKQGAVQATAQDHSQATYASKISLEEGKIDWNLSSQKIHNLVRAFSPRPGAWSLLPEGKRIKILRTRKCEGKGPSGKILSPSGIVGCGKGALQILEVQPEGKKVMKAPDWLRGAGNYSLIFLS